MKDSSFTTQGCVMHTSRKVVFLAAMLSNVVECDQIVLFVIFNDHCLKTVIKHTSSKATTIFFKHSQDTSTPAEWRRGLRRTFSGRLTIRNQRTPRKNSCIPCQETASSVANSGKTSVLYIHAVVGGKRQGQPLGEPISDEHLLARGYYRNSGGRSWSSLTAHIQDPVLYTLIRAKSFSSVDMLTITSCG